MAGGASSTAKLPPPRHLRTFVSDALERTLVRCLYILDAALIVAQFIPAPRGRFGDWLDGLPGMPWGDRMIWLLAATVVLVLVGSYLAYSKMRGRLDTTLHLGLSSKGAPRPETPNEIELVVLNKSEIAKDTGIEIELFHHVKNQRASSGRMHVSPSLTLKPGAEYRHVLAKIEGGPLRDRKLQLSANGSSYPGLPMRAITIECLLTADSSRPIQRFHVLTTDLAKIDLMEFKPRKPEAKH